MENNAEVADIGEISERAFGVRVRELRSALGMTQAELAGRMTSLGYGMSQTMVAKLERGARPTSIGELAVLGSIFGVPPADLLSGDTLPPDVARLSELRLRVYSEIAALTELISQWENLGTSVKVRRERLRGAIRLLEETLEELSATRGEKWLSAWGVDTSNYFASDERVTKLLADV